MEEEDRWIDGPDSIVVGSQRPRENSAELGQKVLSAERVLARNSRERCLSSRRCQGPIILPHIILDRAESPGCSSFVSVALG